MVVKGSAVLAAGAGWVGCFFFVFFFISPILSSFSNASSLGRRLDILKYCGLGRYNPTVVVSYYRRRAREVLVNRLVGLVETRFESKSFHFHREYQENLVNLLN